MLKYKKVIFGNKRLLTARQGAKKGRRFLFVGGFCRGTYNKVSRVPQGKAC